MSSFQSAVTYVNDPANKGSIDNSNDIQLSFYKYYKQATVGDCDTPRPGMTDIKGKAKWDAWNSITGMSKEDAEANYVSTLQRAAPDYS
ncbi:acyl-CoA-binding protein [Nocardia sp. SYP-A9097]|uniref:acyl-CoA-binding domain-containing protein n=1 Tax=Nocardia sp. SYP-A9097 TaxID=2663237 RepID=UPI00129AA86F|nr:acyl-CoA-binding protein [Nocardia sp. SYP-A9097]MRH93031.1 acyl-CoA-binding protein [Nocardia sp. SYP-A9097]